MGRRMDQKLETHETIYYREVCSLADAYRQDTAYTAEPVLKWLRALYRHVRAGEEYPFQDQGGIQRTIDRERFQEFVLKHFDERAYCWACGLKPPRGRTGPKTIDVMAVRKKLGSGEALSYEDLASLVRTYREHTDTTCQWVVRTLRMMYEALDEGARYQYYDVSGALNDLTKETFRDFVLRFFDAKLYRWVLDEA